MDKAVNFLYFQHISLVPGALCKETTMIINLCGKGTCLPVQHWLTDVFFHSATSMAVD